MTDARQLNHLINVLYETALNPGRWAEAIGLCGQYVGGTAAQLLTIDKKQNRPIASIQSAAAFNLQNSPGTDNRSINIDNLCELAVDKWLCCDHNDTQPEFNQNFFIYHKTHYAMVAWVDDNENYHSVLGVVRSADQQPFGHAEQMAVQHFSSHLQRALRLQKYTQDLHTQAELRARAIDALAMSMLIVDEKGTILHLNAGAERLLNNRVCALVAKSGRITTAPLLSKNKLSALVAGATGNPAVSGAMFLDGDQTRRAFVTPLAATAVIARSHQSPLALILVMNADKNLPTFQLLAKLYELSPAEVRVASSLMAGKSPELYAQEAAVKISTVRSQLANLFRKTNTCRQSELVAVLGQMPPLQI